MSASCASRTAIAISSPATSGTPRPSQRANTCRNGPCTSGPSPTSSANADATWQCAIIASATARPPVTTNAAASRARRSGALPAPARRSRNASIGNPSRSIP